MRFAALIVLFCSLAMDAMQQASAPLSFPKINAELAHKIITAQQLVLTVLEHACYRNMVDIVPQYKKISEAMPVYGLPPELWRIIQSYKTIDNLPRLWLCTLMPCFKVDNSLTMRNDVGKAMHIEQLTKIIKLSDKTKEEKVTIVPMLDDHLYALSNNTKLVSAGIAAAKQGEILQRVLHKKRTETWRDLRDKSYVVYKGAFYGFKRLQPLDHLHNQCELDESSRVSAVRLGDDCNPSCYPICVYNDETKRADNCPLSWKNKHISNTAIRSMALNSTGSLLAVAFSNYSLRKSRQSKSLGARFDVECWIHLIDITSHTIVKELKIKIEQPEKYKSAELIRSVQFTPCDGYLFALGTFGMQVLDAQTGQIVACYAHPAGFSLEFNEANLVAVDTDETCPVSVLDEIQYKNGWFLYKEHPTLYNSRYQAQVWQSAFHDVVLTPEQFFLIGILEKWRATHQTVNLALCAQAHTLALSDMQRVLASCTQVGNFNGTLIPLKDKIKEIYAIT